MRLAFDSIDSAVSSVSVLFLLYLATAFVCVVYICVCFGETSRFFVYFYYLLLSRSKNEHCLGLCVVLLFCCSAVLCCWLIQNGDQLLTRSLPTQVRLVCELLKNVMVYL